jgi:membrane-associated phospholipid phosphatase
MKKETYIKMTQPFRDNPGMAKGIHIANKLCTGVMYLAYPILLLWIFFHADAFDAFALIRAILVPGISFVLLSVGRSRINRPRPYEAFGVPPVIPKDTKGHSFPSRHVFSAMIIAMTFVCISPWTWLGTIFIGVSLLLAIVRVVSGVHYISDVVAGILIAVVAALLGYFII